jgi:hypothetical protein
MSTTISLAFDVLHDRGAFPLSSIKGPWAWDDRAITGLVVHRCCARRDTVGCKYERERRMTKLRICA